MLARLCAGDAGPVFIEPGDVAGAHQAVGDVDDGMDGPSDDSITDEDDDQGHDPHDYADDEEEAALLEDELHMMQQQLDGQPQEVRVLKMLGHNVQASRPKHS